jgi:rsbT co-antagonist protein RsbR
VTYYRRASGCRNIERQLTEQLLGAVRENRAKVVVIDITGVQAVDSNVANHMVQG